LSNIFIFIAGVHIKLVAEVVRSLKKVGDPCCRWSRNLIGLRPESTNLGGAGADPETELCIKPKSGAGTGVKS